MTQAAQTSQVPALGQSTARLALGGGIGSPPPFRLGSPPPVNRLGSPAPNRLVSPPPVNRLVASGPLAVVSAADRAAGYPLPPAAVNVNMVRVSFQQIEQAIDDLNRRLDQNLRNEDLNATPFFEAAALPQKKLPLQDDAYLANFYGKAVHAGGRLLGRSVVEISNLKQLGTTLMQHHTALQQKYTTLQQQQVPQQQQQVPQQHATLQQQHTALQQQTAGLKTSLARAQHQLDNPKPWYSIGQDDEQTIKDLVAARWLTLSLNHGAGSACMRKQKLLVEKQASDITRKVDGYEEEMQKLSIDHEVNRRLLDAMEERADAAALAKASKLQGKQMLLQMQQQLKYNNLMEQQKRLLAVPSSFQPVTRKSGVTIEEADDDEGEDLEETEEADANDLNQPDK
jgi:hypothetical protein